MEKKNALGTQIEALRKLTTAELKRRYRKVFGEATKSNNKPYLLKRIAYLWFARMPSGWFRRG